MFIFQILQVSTGYKCNPVLKFIPLNLLLAGFGGCIRNMRYKERPDLSFVDIRLAGYFEELSNVNLDGCPRHVTSEVTCRPNNVQKIYRGANNATFDFGLEPFTGKYLVTDLNLFCEPILRCSKKCLGIQKWSGAEGWC